MKLWWILAVFGVLAASPCRAQEFTLHEDDYAKRGEDYSPYVDQHFPQTVYFGDTHLHTSWSADAGLAGATLGPEFAYRVSRGEAVKSQTGLPFKLVRPLDPQRLRKEDRRPGPLHPPQRQPLERHDVHARDL